MFWTLCLRPYEVFLAFWQDEPIVEDHDDDDDDDDEDDDDELEEAQADGNFTE